MSKVSPSKRRVARLGTFAMKRFTRAREDGMVNVNSAIALCAVAFGYV